MVRSVAPVLAVFLILAGCLSLGDQPSAVGEGATWGEAVLIDGGADAETSLHIDGDVFLVCAHGGFIQASPVWASTDGGATFARQVIEPNPIVSGDCDVDILEDGSWVVVYDTIASATIAVSRDQGASWSINYAAALPIKVDRPWIAHDGNTIIMSYANVMAVEPAIGMVATSNDHGLTWSHTVYALFESADRPNHIHGDILVSEDGWRIPVGRADFNIGQGEGTLLDLYTSVDGSAWTRSPVATTDTTFILPSLAEDGEGTFYYAVPRRAGPGMVDIHVAWSTDRGATWTESEAVARNQTLSGVVGPWIDGKPGVGATMVWRNVTGETTSFNAVEVALAADGLAAGPVVELFASDHRPGQIYEFIMVRHDADGLPVAALLHDDGSGCNPDPNPAMDRGSQCLWLVRQEA